MRHADYELTREERQEYYKNTPPLPATGVEVRDRDTALRYVATLFTRIATFDYEDKPIEAVCMLSAGLQYPNEKAEDAPNAMGWITRGLDTLIGEFIERDETLLLHELVAVAPDLCRFVVGNAEGMAARGATSPRECKTA